LGTAPSTYTIGSSRAVASGRIGPARSCGEQSRRGVTADQVRELLSEATRRLLPKASDEAEAAHPH
jgi:hypothetical protein